ncbi:MAG TPA: Fic family protein [Blastocatellia bacterium]|nr:Fic family protein [Blastocatellia bacterium]
MNSFRGERLKKLTIPTSTAWLLADIAESKGRQDLYTKQSPQILKALLETALVESVESSNRIEGVTVERERLRPLVLGNARPRDRSEQEIQGYRNALKQIHTGWQSTPISPDTLRRLHLTIQEGVGDAGRWKTVENDIIEFRSGSAPVVRFRPVPASATPDAIGELCLSYNHVINQEVTPPLIAIACLVLDFLCIHPFRDGNGRVSRLLTLLGAYQHGYEVGRYISIERLVEQSKEDYYEVLRLSSDGWHEQRHDLTPWLNYFLTVLRRAYREFEQRVGQVKSPRGTKTALIEAAIAGIVGEFSLAELERACPGVSRDMIRRVLRDLQKAGKVECVGLGPGARWRKRG